MTMDEYKPLREHLGLDENSKVLLFSTEGDTDPIDTNQLSGTEMRDNHFSQYNKKKL